MNDQCKHCTVRGDIKACKATECSIHESWYAVEQKKKVAALEKENEQLKIYVKTSGVRAREAAHHYYKEQLTSNTEHMADQDARLARMTGIIIAQGLKMDQHMANHAIEINRLMRVYLEIEEECERLGYGAMGENL